MTVLETWTCPQHGIIAKGVTNSKPRRPRSMIDAINYHRIQDHCYAFLSIHSVDVVEDSDTLNKENAYRQSEETQK